MSLNHEKLLSSEQGERRLSSEAARRLLARCVGLDGTNIETIDEMSARLIHHDFVSSIAPETQDIQSDKNAA